MKATLIVASLVCLFNLTRANTYYFSSVSGDDSRSSTEAKSSSTPWKTLKKLNSFFSSLKPGDFVLLKRGETFYGSIIVNNSGTSSSPITIGAYGTGNKPIITSLATLGNWVSKGNGIWESYNSSFGSAVNMVLLNGVEQARGRYPNSNASNKGYLTFESHAGTTSITDKELTSTINWTGAELVLKSKRWLLDRNKITYHSGGTIYCNRTGTYEPKNGFGYFIQNSIKTLDKFGEWYYNPSTKKLSVFFGSNQPSSYTIGASTTDNLIYSENHSSVVFNSLTIKGANNSGFNVTGGSNIQIQSCDILFSGVDGIDVDGHSNLKIENCTILNSNNNGIRFGYGVNYSTVKNNKILNTSLIAGMGLGGDGNGEAIYSSGDGNNIEYNEIRGTGYIGVCFKGNNVIIKNNFIDSFCLVKDDGSAIYSHGYYAYKGSKIIGNIIRHGLGAPYGTGGSIYSTSGVYIDINNSSIEIRDNTFSDCHDYGIYVHNSSNLTIKNNTLFNNSRRQLTILEESDHPSSVRNHIISNNIFFSKVQEQLVSYLESSANDITYFGKFDSNYYARPLDDRITIYNHYPGFVKNLDLDGWKKQYGDDPASRRTAKQIVAYKVNSLMGSNKFSNGFFTSGITGVSGSSCSISWSTSGLLDGGYLQASPTAARSYLSIKIGGLTAGKKYILKYSSKGSVENNMSLSASLKQAVSPYTPLTPQQTRKVSTTRTENEMIFLATSSQSSTYLVFEADQQSKYYLDNIKVYEADAIITNPDDSIKFVYNASQASKSISLSGSYIDTKGNKFSNSITLSPYKSAVLIKTGTTTALATSGPTVSITSPSNNAKYTSPASITFSASATTPDGTISKVDFYKGTTLIHSEDVSPYKWTWNDVPAGNYTITAKATDNSGNTATSSGISISVVANQAPTVSITSPLVNAKYTAPASIYMKVAAADVDGTISKVEFYKNGTWIHTEDVSPFAWTWNDVPAGNYTLTAKATDNNGAKATSAGVAISVVTNTLARSSVSSVDTVATTEAANLTKGDSTGAVSQESLSNGLATLNVGPNPARNDLSIFTSGLQQDKKLTISVYSTSGMLIKTMQAGNANQVVQMDISSLSKGIYILRVISGNSVLSSKFMKL